MKEFFVNYFSLRMYIMSDISLMKYLLTVPEIEKEFNIEKISIYSNIDSCNNFFLNLKEEDLLKENEYFNENIKNEERNLKYINSIFEFLLLIIRDDLSMINLAFKLSSSFRMKYRDIVFETLLKTEKNNFENIIKNQIIHYILGNKNLVKRENCTKLFDCYKNYLNLKFIDDFLKEDCDEISLSNQLKQFSLKKNIFSFCDIDYIIDYKSKVNAINYMTEFQSNNFNLINTYIVESLNIQKKLNSKIYEAFFNKNNIEKLINLYKIIISNKNCTKLSDIFLLTFSKIFSFYIKLYKNDLKHEDNLKKLNEIIGMDKYEGNNSKLIQYIQNLLLNENIKNDSKNEKLNKKKLLKEKYKKKFNKQIQLLTNKYSSSNIDFEEENIDLQKEEICIYCRLPLNDDLNNYYGKICYFCKDYFFNNIQNKERQQKSIRCLTCNHKIHFKCYSKFILKFINKKNVFLCPLCKKLSNVIICDFNNLIEKDKFFFEWIKFR